MPRSCFPIADRLHPLDGFADCGESLDMASLVVRSALFPVPHGFSTRLGGVSAGPFASLNLAEPTEDDRARVAENLRLLAQSCGFRSDSLRTVSQVHGDRVVEAASPGGSGGEADALWTGELGIAVGVRTADCVPILLADPVGRRVAAVHSGWRGTVARVSARAVEALAQKGTRPADLVAAIGPSIRACCYRVSTDLAQRFADFGPGVVIEEGGGVHLDLAIAVRASLVACGVAADRIDLLPDCTSCDPARFFSHRRDLGVTGRHLSFAVCEF